MEPLTLECAYKLRDYYKTVVASVNESFERYNIQIENILVAPSDIQDQWNFFNCYLESRDNEEALRFYMHNEYCVIAMIRELQSDNNLLYSYRTLDNVLNAKEVYEPHD